MEPRRHEKSCVPKTTLIRICQSQVKSSELLTKTLVYNPILSKDIEDDLVKYTKEMTQGIGDLLEEILDLLLFNWQK